jgi:hypothetical protein
MGEEQAGKIGVHALIMAGELIQVCPVLGHAS